MQRRQFLHSLAAISAAASVSCSGAGSPPATTDSVELFVQPGDELTPSRFYTHTGEVQSTDVRQMLVAGLAREDQTVSLNLLPDTFIPPADTSGRWATDFDVWRYTVRIRLKPSYVGGCIRRNQQNLVIQVQDRWNNYNNLCDIHILVWWDRGPQAGIYNSLGNHQFCTQTSGTFTAIRNAIHDALETSLLAGAAGWILWTVADTGAVAGVAVFAI